jgi:hypothetical protein
MVHLVPGLPVKEIAAAGATVRTTVAAAAVRVALVQMQMLYLMVVQEY